MTLSELLPGAVPDPRLRDLEVAGISADSRSVGPGCVFFAVPGTRADGMGFVAQAVAAGAAAVVTERAPENLLAGTPAIVVPNARRALCEAAARFHPRQPETIVAVTGTSGKTSVTAFVRQIWASTGARAASLGTIGIVAPADVTPPGSAKGSLTTPDPVALHRDVDALARAGVTHLAIEASSHGLDQHRLDGLRLAAGAFTNLSRDHLDYHPTLDHYLAAKLRLFTALLSPGQTAVVAVDHRGSDGGAVERVIAATTERGLKLVTVGAGGDDIRLVSSAPDGFSTRLTLDHGGKTVALRLPLAGAFQVSNALVAAGLCIATGTPAAAAFAALETLAGAPGRLEHVGSCRGAPVFVDYAHKPDALVNVLTTLRPYAAGRLVLVFGCGGDRDAGKRPIMGDIAARLADIVIVTDDNPRSEDPAAIRAAILAACPGGRDIADRGDAIAAAVGLLAAGDVLVVAGKGHETGQTAGGVTRPFADAEAVADAIARTAA